MLEITNIDVARPPTTPHWAGSDEGLQVFVCGSLAGGGGGPLTLTARVTSDLHCGLRAACEICTFAK